MKIRKYIASTMKDALEEMRKELGEDAVILSTRSIPRSAANSREAVEITAAADPADEPQKKRPLVAAANPAPYARDILQYAENFAREAVPATRQAQHAPKHSAAPARSAVRTVDVPPVAHADDTVQSTQQVLQQQTAFIRLQEELSSIRDTLHTVAGEVRYKHSGSLTPGCRRIYEALIDAGLREHLALETIGSITARGLASDISGALVAARKHLLSSIDIGEPLTAVRGRRRVYAFVGSTGMGKTTTIAKLATALHVLGSTRVLLLSADTYRVGGAEQLETIAAIAGIPFRSVYSPQELRQAILKATDVDCVFVDTVGRNPRNEGHIQEIRVFMEAAAPDRAFLVQSATASEAATVQAISRFTTAGATDMILTKLDEAPAIGPIVNALHSQSLPIAYMTTGQTIPDDIEQAGRRLLADLLLPPSLESEDQEVTIE